MKFVFLGILLFSTLANAADIGSKEIVCNYTVVTVYHSDSNIKIIPFTKQGQLILHGSGLQYGPSEVRIDNLSLKVSAQIATDLFLELNVSDVNQNNDVEFLAHLSGFFNTNSAGAYKGELATRSSKISTIAAKQGISFDEAATSELTPIGLNFVEASFTCH